MTTVFSEDRNLQEAALQDNRRILLIDDTHAIHEDFRKILVEQPVSDDLDQMEEALFGAPQQRGAVRFQVESAYQGEEGLARLRGALQGGAPFAMAFVDMRMPPGWDGVETIERLWEADPRLQVVICTAYSDYGWQEVLERLEVGDRLLVLKKPFDAVEVCQLAGTLTAKWNLARQAELKMAALEEAVRLRTCELGNANRALEADIVERKKAEQEAGEAYRRVWEILEFLPDATMVVDAQGKVVAWNRAMEAMSGVPKQEMLNRGEHSYAVPFYGHPRKILVDMLHEEPAEVLRSYPSVKIEGKTLTCEARLALHDGVHHVWSAATPLYDVQGAKAGGIQSLRDITDFKRSEEERMRLEARLHHTALIDGLLAQLGHDLKTPLTPLFALLPLVQKKVSDPTAERMLDICQRSVGQIHGLTTKALDLVRLSCRDRSDQLEPVPLAATLQMVMAGCAHVFSERGVVCLNSVDPAIVVEGAAEQLNLLLDNLLSNAARYAARDGKVLVGAALDGDYVVVSVQDDGVGLQPGQREQIFDEFFKGDSARHDLNTQGLGLAICKRIVLNHNGKIWAQSDGPGQGTTVSFTLRLSKAA